MAQPPKNVKDIGNSGSDAALLNARRAYTTGG